MTESFFFCFPPAPPGGGVLVLNPAQFANKDLRAAIAKIYPDTLVIESKSLPLHRPDKPFGFGDFARRRILAAFGFPDDE